MRYDKPCEFSINLYAMDDECMKAFHMMQFGNMAEKCIKKPEDKYISLETFSIKVLDKEDIIIHWTGILAC